MAEKKTAIEGAELNLNNLNNGVENNENTLNTENTNLDGEKKIVGGSVEINPDVVNEKTETGEPTVETSETNDEDRQALLDRADALMVQSAQMLAQSQEAADLAQTLISLASEDDGGNDAPMVLKSAPMMLAASAGGGESLPAFQPVGKPLAQMTEGTTPTANDYLTMIQGGAARKVLVSALKAYIDTASNEASPDAVFTKKGSVKTTTSIADLASVVAGQMPLKAAVQDGVFVMFHRKSANYPLMVKPHKWPSYQTSGEIADGVVIVEGGHVLVVAPTESASKLYWSSAAVSAGGTTTTDRVTAMDDWNGKQNTTNQVTHSECNTTAFPAGYCHAYSRVNSNGNGLTAGKWWLPSMGEMMMIYANMTKVNYALSLIEGATRLVEDAYWTSTECSAAYAWYLTLGGGTMGDHAKASGQFHVRAVSAFIS